MSTLPCTSALAGSDRNEIVRAPSVNASSSVGVGGSYRLLGADQCPGPAGAVEDPVERDVGQWPAGPRSARDIAMRPAEPDLFDPFVL